MMAPSRGRRICPPCVCPASTKLNPLDFAQNRLSGVWERRMRNEGSEPSFRILLSHTPDNLFWAKSNGFNLVLAGHTHGGQIRLPRLGAIIAPSFHGSRYAGGLYFEPPTLMHVSRG